MGKKFILTLFLAGVLALPSFGQTFGGMTGVVYDSTGSVIVDARVVVTNPQTNFTRETITNNTGAYSFANLLPGLYNIRAEKQGFQGELHNGIELQVQQTARIDFRLNVGLVTETVEVTGGAPLINTENATVGTVIEQKRITDLPINGRSFVSLIALSPNVTTGQTANTGQAATRGGSDRTMVGISVAGMRREFTYYTMDGVSNTDVSYNTYAFLPSIDALQEFKVQTGVYSAEFGREAAQVNIVTKSGTNQYHGTVFEFLRNNRLDARPFAFTSRVPASAPFRLNQYGFTLGGPVQIPKLFNGRDRLFFMSNFEGYKRRRQFQQTYSTAPAVMRTGNFSQLLPATTIVDPLNRNAAGVKQPFPGNIIPPQRLDRIALGLLEFYPVPNIPGTGLTNNMLDFQNQVTDKDQFTQRMDFVENGSSNWFGRYSWQNDFLSTPSLGAGIGTTVSNVVKQAMISNVRIFSPTLVNEFRFGYLGFNNNNLSFYAFKRDVDKELAIPFYFDPPPDAWGVPTVAVAGFTSWGDSGNGPFVTNNHTFQFIDNIGWTHGNHSIKFGGEFRRDRYNDYGNQASRGGYTVQNQATNYAFSDYMTGYAQQTGGAGGLAVLQLRSSTQAYYINDNWKIRPNLTLDFGLRYEYTPPWTMKGDSMMNVITPFVGRDPLEIINNPAARVDLQPYYVRNCAAYGQTDFYVKSVDVRFDQALPKRCITDLGTSLVKPDRNDFAPRIGLAWSPTDKWTVRAGFGTYYVQDVGSTYLDVARNSAGRAFVVADTTHNLTFQRPFPAEPKCGVPSPPFVCVTLPFFLSNDINRRTPLANIYELNIQRQLTGSTVLEVGYLGSQGHKLQRGITINGAIPAATGSVASRSAFPEWGTGQQTVGWVSSNYHGGSIKLTRRLSNGLSALAGFTYAKSMDDGSALVPGNSLEGNRPARAWCLRCEYSVSSHDTRLRFVASILYELPFGKGKPFLNRGIASNILGGWQLNSIIVKSTGFPVNMAMNNQSNSNTQFDRPDATVGENVKLDNPTTGQWFNVRAVRLQTFGTYGNVGRNSMLGPGIFSWDFSTLKNINFTERTYLQFRFECFNCGNHPNFGDPGLNMGANRTDAAGIPIPGTGLFGQITSTRFGIDMRQLQFSLKLIF